MNARGKSLALLCSLLALVTTATGCARRYIITTISGTKVVTASKPRLVESKFVFRDANGRTNELSTLRVRSIEPYSKEALGSPMKLPELR